MHDDVGWVDKIAHIHVLTQGSLLEEPSSATPSRFVLGKFCPARSEVLSVLYQDIIKVAFENGINMFDTAEAYAKGKSEEEM